MVDLSAKNCSEKLEEVEFSRIFNDPALDWFPEELEASEKALVLENPSLNPWLVQAQEGEKQLLLVDGYRRMRCLKAAGFDESQKLECRIIPAEFPKKAILLFRLQSLPSSKRETLSGYGSIRILQHFQEAGMKVQEMSERVLPLIGEPPSLHRANRMLQLGNRLASEKVPETLKKMSVQDLMPLLRFSSDDLPALMELAEKMKMGGNKWKTMLQLVDEICRIRNIKAREFLEEKDCRSLLENRDLQGPVLYRQFKQLLDRQRNPELSQLREQFERLSKGLKLPQGVQMENDDFFEKEELLLKIKASSSKELLSQLERLRDCLDQSEMEAIFRMLQG